MDKLPLFENYGFTNGEYLPVKSELLPNSSGNIDISHLTDFVEAVGYDPSIVKPSEIFTNVLIDNRICIVAVGIDLDGNQFMVAKDESDWVIRAEMGDYPSEMEKFVAGSGEIEDGFIIYRNPEMDL